MTDQTPSPSALYQRANRLKKKLKAQEEKDLIEKQQIAQAKKITQHNQQRRKQGIDIESDNWGREPERNLVKQYPEQKNEFGFNVWDDDSSTHPTVNPLDKVSHQENLKALFGSKYAED
jgi:hypothetical protein